MKQLQNQSARLLLTISLLVLILIAVPILRVTDLDIRVFAQNTDQTTTADPPATTSDTDPSLEMTPTPNAEIVPVDTIFIKPQDTERLKALLKLYQDQVEKYRTSEREYRQSKAQFLKLNTLQSLEEAIVKTRQVMLDRDDVLITYLEMVRAHLQETDGIEITLKTTSDKELETQILALKEHRQKLEQTTDREALKERVSEFTIISELINTRAYTALTLISLGDLQAVYDRSLIVYKEIKTLHAETPVSALKQQERERAYREVDNSIELLRLNLEEIRVEVNDVKVVQTNRYKSVFQQEFGSIYAKNSQLLEFLKELLLELT